MQRAQSIISRLAKKYKTPTQVQKYLRSFTYNRELKGETLSSAIETAKKKSAHCLEATFLAAAILERHGYLPLAMSIESQDHLDHVIYVYQNAKGLWGSIGRSRDPGLHGRRPVFKNLRALTRSYFDPYIDKTGKITGFRMVNLDHTKADWRWSKKNVWKAEQYLIDIKHQKLPSSKARYKKMLKNYLAHGPLTKGPHWL